MMRYSEPRQQNKQREGCEQRPWARCSVLSIDLDHSITKVAVVSVALSLNCLATRGARRWFVVDVDVDSASYI